MVVIGVSRSGVWGRGLVAIYSYVCGTGLNGRQRMN